MFDVVALGESLIDFTPSGINDMGMQLFACNPGGAPANVLAMNARLGGKTAFIGKVGEDDFGRFLQSVMKDAGIDITGLCMAKDVNTTLAFVHLNSQGDRSFSFYRKPGADVMLRTDEVKAELVTGCRIFHFGSVSLTDDPCRSATLSAARAAKDAGAIISYDPNYRPFLWESEEKARAEILLALPMADILKVSEEEMVLLTDESDLGSGAAKLAHEGPSLVLVTLGPKGAFFFTRKASGLLPAYDVKTVDTTGAGDAFLGALHYCIAGKSLTQLQTMQKQEWESAIAFANAAGSLTTTRKGAIPAMPDLKAIENCMKANELL